MADIVITIPKKVWAEWLEEGDCAGEPYTGRRYVYWTGGRNPTIQPDERVYVVAHGRLRGWAPLDYAYGDNAGRIAFVRKGGAVAVTIEEPIRGFRGFRYRWWPLADEVPFPKWRTP